MLTTTLVGEFLNMYYERLMAEEAHLNELDSVVGDGEHGFNLKKSYSLVMEKLPEFAGLPLGDYLRKVGMTLLSAGGGTGATLYGFSFMKAAEVQATAGQDLAASAAIFRAALDMMKERGKARPGDKTLIDAFEPAVDALEAAVGGSASAAEAFSAAAKAAQAGAESTANMVGKMGRALYAGERGVGTADPGATSTALFFATLADLIKG
jgi:dihydroxyacetone kinase-like protein